MTRKLPLEGVRVVELGTSVAAPYGTWILATLGADVVKVERPEVGDDCRQWGPPSVQEGLRSFFLVLNANKKSIVVDLTNADERDRLRRYIADNADVVVQNLRPGLVERYGFSADDLMPENPRLIYCHSGAFGNDGPYKDRPGYDPLMQACGGIMSINGEEGRPPARVGTSIVDMGTGMWIAIGVLAAIHQRDETGKGCRIDASLYETALGWIHYHAAGYYGTGKAPKRVGSKAPGIAPYQAYECADGYLVVAAANDRLFEKMSGALGHPEWAEDPRFGSNLTRWDNLETLNAALEGVLRAKPRAHWQTALDAAGVPNAPTQSIDEVLIHPQTLALNILQETDDAVFKLLGLPLQFDGDRPPQRTGAPSLGANTKEILGE
ncbi:MAG: CoA transferase [Alphaproteobacteria bacterium]|nr:CoA transferase [Alphaproteobacteria bacterium]